MSSPFGVMCYGPGPLVVVGPFLVERLVHVIQMDELLRLVRTWHRDIWEVSERDILRIRGLSTL